MLTQLTSHPPIYGVPFTGCDERYQDRATAGHQLADLLRRYRGGRALVLALSPGGVAVAGEVARGLRLPLDVIVAREMHLGSYPRVVAAGVSEGNGLCINQAVLRLPGVSLDDVWREARRAAGEITALVEFYRHGRRLPPSLRRPVILVDDGLGSGLAQLAAIQALRRARVQSCVVATAGGSVAARQHVSSRADAVVALAADVDEGRDGARRWQRSPGDDEAAELLERYRLCSALEQP